MLCEPLRIVSVDDNPLDSHVLERRLQNATAPRPIEFLALTKADEALECIRTFRPDLIFLDYHLGDTDGATIARRLAAAGSSAPVVILTGGAGESSAIAAHRAGVSGYMLKSDLKSPILRQVVESALNRSHGENDETQLQAQLMQQAQEIESFHHSLSHELKTPLTACLEFTSIVLDGIAGPLTEEQREYLEIAESGYRRIRAIVTDMLDASLLGSGKVCLRLEPCDPQEIASRVIQTLRAQAEEKELRVTTSFSDPLLPATADGPRLEMALTKILENAIQFSSRQSEIEFVVAADGEPEGANPSVTFEVVDQGPGIDAAQHQAIFDRMVQLHTDDPALSPGLGLGLFIAKQIVALHGGELTVSSEPGRGSRFSIRVPASLTDHSPQERTIRA